MLDKISLNLVQTALIGKQIINRWSNVKFFVTAQHIYAYNTNEFI